MTRVIASRLAILTVGLLLASCRNDPQNGQIPSYIDSVHTDRARLGRILRWDSLVPRSASYRITVFGSGSDRVPGPTDWSIEAILRYDPATFEALERALKRQGMSDSVQPANIQWEWLDSADRNLLARSPRHEVRENRIFPIEGCPFGKVQIAASNTLLLWCHSR